MFRQFLRGTAVVGACLALVAAVAVTSPADAGYAGRFYVALGDSLSVGVQPQLAGVAAGNRRTPDGYPDQLETALRGAGHDVRLAGFGCSGATTTQLLDGGRCHYQRSRSQLDAALSFIGTRPDRVALVTVDIGINDVMRCLAGQRVSTPCVRRGLAAVRRNLPVTLRRLRAAAPNAPVVAMTYYDPMLAVYPAAPAYARRTGAVFAELNAVITAACRQAGARVADVAGAYGTTELTRSERLPDGRTAPVAVARVCRWTWMCADPPVGPNLHANTAGYRTIARAYGAASGLATDWGS